MSQLGIVRRLLKEAGPKGVSAHRLLTEFGITRAAAYVYDLRQEGMNIATIDDGDLADGRSKMARYVLRNSQPAMCTVFDAADPAFNGSMVAKEISFDCGCVRSVDGRYWGKVCVRHAGARASD